MLKKLALIALFLSPLPAQADVFVWSDPVDKLTMTFPENWMRQTNTNPDMRIMVLAPQGNDFASCRVMRVENDKFLSAPANGQSEVTAFVNDPKTVESYLWQSPDITQLTVTKYSADAGIGRAPAVHATADFTKNWGGQAYDLTATAYFTQARGVARAFVCESLTQAVGRWQPVFENILRSVDFGTGYGITPNGYYRDFVKDGGVVFDVDNGVRDTGVTKQ